MQEYNNPASQGAANTFAQANDYIWQPVAGQIAGMKAANPACDFGPYAKGIMYQGNTSGNALPTDFPLDWYCHDAFPFTTGNRVNSTFGTTIWIMNPQSTSAWTDTSGEAGVVNKVYNGFIDFHKHWLLNRIQSSASYTNTFADSMGTQSMNGQIDPTSHAAETTTTWFAKLNTAYVTVQAFIHAAGFEVHPNGLVTNASCYNYGDGAMLENALRQPTDGTLAAYSSTTLQSKWNTHGQRIMDTQAAGKACFPLTQILTGSTGITHGSAAEQAWREYTAAAFYILDLGKLYWDFNCFADSATDHGLVFARDLKTPMDSTPPSLIADLKLVAGTSGNLYGRRYLRGYALLNTASNNITFTLPRSDYKKAVDGTAQAASITVNARTGVVLYALVDDPAGGPPPPPPPPPDQTTFFDMDFGVNTPTTTPWGFDLIPNGVGAGATMEVLGAPAHGQLHIKQVSTLATGPFGRNNIPTGNSDVWYRFVLDNIVAPSALTTFLLSQPSGGSNNGDLSLRINTSKQWVVRWNASSAADFTDSVVIANGDLVELRHLLNGTVSGYELWINNVLRHSNVALTAPSGATVSFVNMGFPAAINGESYAYRFGASTDRMGTPTSLVNTDNPALTISNPANGTVYTQNTTVPVSVSASDNDGISLMEIQLDSGSWQTMTGSGGVYTASISLTGSAGVAQAHTLTVRATDAYPDVPTRRQSTASVTVSVNIPGADTTKPVVTVTSPSAVNSTVANGVATQVFAGSVTDNVGVTSYTINGTVTTLDDSGNFSVTLPINVGSNSFALVAKDAAGNTTTVTYTVTRQAVVANNPPVLIVNTPGNGDVYPINTVSLVLSGTASDSDGTVTGLNYTYDGSPPVAVVLSAGVFSKTISVGPGNHTIVVTATDDTGLTASQTVSIAVLAVTPGVDTSGASRSSQQLDFGKGTVLVRV